MSGSLPVFCLDSDSFIRSKQQHYAFDICPGYWEAVLRGHENNRVVSIQPVYEELTRGSDALGNWAKGTVPGTFFLPVDAAPVVNAYKTIMKWAEENEQYNRGTVAKFAGCADPWIIAAAMVNEFVVVTYETLGSKSKVKIPDAAKAFGVSCIPPYVMLRQLKTVFLLEP